MQVHALTVAERKLFWVKMKNVKNGLGIKSTSDILGKELETTQQKNKRKNI